MSASKLDAVYRSFLITKFFTKGWGKPENLRRLFEFRKVVSNRDECFKLVEKDYPVTITKEQKLADCRLLEGFFITPLERYLPGIVPEIAQKAHFQILLPEKWQDPNYKPVCLHLAGTGDHFFWRRRNLMVKPLLKEAGIGGIILENPFYGLRKPVDQVRSSLHNVSDIFVMGGCLILESLVLFHWCEQNGLGPLGVTGLSMGGHMASLAATNWPKPLVLVPCLSWSTASAVFLQGVMSHSINWDLLEDQYLSDGVYREKLSKMVTVIDEAFLAGKKFVQSYSRNIQKENINSEPENNIKPETHVENVETKPATAKETDNIIDLNRNIILKTKIPPEANDDLKVELTNLLNENKISKQLYDKLLSNRNFELEPQDIEILNNLNKEHIRERVLLKFQKKEVNHFSVETKKSLENKGTATVHEKLHTTDKIIETTQTTRANELMLSKNVDTKIEKKPWNVSDLATDFLVSLPFLKTHEKKIDISKINWRDREALQFMRGIMDECTHLSNFSVPFDTSLIIAVCAKHDAYVPRDDVGTLEEIWPGAEVRYVDAGHVSAYILHQSLFRSCIKEAFERSKKRWRDGKHVD
ncbi:protein ABHD18 isoform X2 [Aricia agestis]|uniref:protein ABHD18 isoform X2 n=1 Tax=Aricia agestis TaxID=91739 RepID=UPI001C209056|nr:protein ABHD18 isoform X2 [Aricia agestis]